MRPYTYIVIAVALATPSHGQQPPAEVPVGEPVLTPAEDGVSRSSSRQFVVHGSTSRGRGAFCVFSEEIKTELLTLLGQPDRWRYPIVLQVRGHTSAMNTRPTVKPKIYKIAGGGFRLQADIDLGDAFTREEMREEVIRLLLAELILRKHPGADLAGRASVLPEWLRIGVSEAIEFRRRGRPTELFASIFKSGKMLTVNDLIYAKPGGLDSVSEAIYRASCCGFVLALVGQDGGPFRMRGMISDLAVFSGTPRDLLEKHFPGTGDSKNSLEKWWALELATMAQPTVKDILDPIESERALGRCLEVSFLVQADAQGSEADGPRGGRKRVWQVFRSKTEREKRGAEEAAEAAPPELVTVDLADYRQFIDRPDSKRLLADVEIKLLQTSYRAFPLHRPMIKEYQEILQRLIEGKTRGVDRKLAELAAARVALARSASDATDYLNWYEATQVGRRSGAFEDYRKAVEELRVPPPPRESPLDRYLDELDKEFR